MIEPKQLLSEIIRPVLRNLALWSEPAERLLLGTACKESNCGLWLVQLGGPALGIYQMEPATEIDCWNNYIQHLQDLLKKINYWRGCWGNGLGPFEMVGNLFYATAMCRVKYLRVAEPIPEDLPGQAAYWKKNYNTENGAGTEREYVEAWRRFIPAGDV